MKAVFAMLAIFLLGMFVGVYGYKNFYSTNSDVTKQETNIDDQTSNGSAFKIDPYNLQSDNNKLIATFRLETSNSLTPSEEVRYWTDKSGACNAKTVKLSEYVDVEVNDATYTFFQMKDSTGNFGQIYAQSHNPLFQCGNLTQ